MRQENRTGIEMTIQNIRGYVQVFLSDERLVVTHKNNLKNK